MVHKGKKTGSSEGLAMTGTIVRHRRAFRDYEILKRYEAGLVLFGSEIKSMNQVFQKVLPTFTENISTLSRITKNLSGEKSLHKKTN